MSLNITTEKQTVIHYLAEMKSRLIAEESDAMAKSETGTDRWAGRSEGAYQALQVIETLEKEYGLSVPSTRDLICSETLAKLRETEAGRKWLGRRITESTL